MPESAEIRRRKISELKERFLVEIEKFSKACAHDCDLEVARLSIEGIKLGTRCTCGRKTARTVLELIIDLESTNRIMVHGLTYENLVSRGLISGP